MTAANLADALDGAGIVLRRYTIGRTHHVPCPRCNHPKGPRDDALAVTIHSADDVVWNCHRCRWAGGWRPRDPMPTRPAIWTHASRSAKPSRHDALAPDWRKFWDSCREITPDSIAGCYLTSRCCAMPQNDVRWHPEAWHWFERRHLPAMVARVTDIQTGEPISLHFTFLKADGSGKAPIDRARLYLFKHRKDGVVRLHPDDEVTQGLIVGEGIETCLTAALEFAPVWACLDAGNLGAFALLAGLEGLTVLIDNDDAGRKAFAEVGQRYAAAGIEVIGIESAGQQGADLNDIARSAA